MPSTAPLEFLVLLIATWLGRHQAEAIEYLRAENRVLRARLPATRLRFTDAERRLLAEKGRPLGSKRLAEVASLATPETILRWYRDLVAAKYSGASTRGPGSAVRPDAVSQLLAMARANPSWGYTRLRGALWNLGLDLGRSTIQRILAEHGIEPAPLRGKTLPWKTFLAAHSGAIAAADFFSVEVVTLRGLVRHLVFFVIELKTRRVHIAGIAPDSRLDGAWMEQVARNLTDAVDGSLRGFTHLIVDRDPLYTRRFAEILASANVELLRLPARSPNLNAYAERFVRSIKSECLRHVIPLGERHLRHVVEEYIEHYHAERNHQGIDNVIPFPARAPPLARGRIRVRERLGGILKFYERKAA